MEVLLVGYIHGMKENQKYKDISQNQNTPSPKIEERIYLYGCRTKLRSKISILEEGILCCVCSCWYKAPKAMKRLLWVLT